MWLSTAQCLTRGCTLYNCWLLLLSFRNICANRYCPRIPLEEAQVQSGWFTGGSHSCVPHAAPSRHHRGITAQGPQRRMGTWGQDRVKGPLNWAWRAESWAGWLCAFRFCTWSCKPQLPLALLFPGCCSSSPEACFLLQVSTTTCSELCVCLRPSLPAQVTHWPVPRPPLRIGPFPTSSALPHPICLSSSPSPQPQHEPLCIYTPFKVLLPQTHALGPVYWSPLKSSFPPITSSLCSKPIFLSLFL